MSYNEEYMRGVVINQLIDRERINYYMKKIVAIMVTAIVLTMGASAANAEEYVSVKVNGEYIKSDVPPRIENNRTIVPIRFVSEALGFKVEWKEATREATISKGDAIIKLTLDSNKAYVNNKEYTLDMPAVERDNRTMVPLRFISENLNCTVDWFEKGRLASVNAFRSDGYPVSLLTRLYQSGEYIIADNAGERYLKKEGLKLRLTENRGQYPTVTDYYNTNLDASIMIDDITADTNDAVKEIFKVVMPKEYDMAYRYFDAKMKPEEVESSGEYGSFFLTRGYFEGRNINVKVSLSKETPTLVTITYPQADSSLPGLR